MTPEDISLDDAAMEGYLRMAEEAMADPERRDRIVRVLAGAGMTLQEATDAITEGSRAILDDPFHRTTILGARER